MIDVDIVKPDVALIDEDLAAFRSPDGDLGPFHDAGGTLFFNLNCAGH